MNANLVYDPDREYGSHPLSYTTSLTVDSTHDGKLSTLVTTCDLVLRLATQHPMRPFPASHIRGRHQIDYIFISKTILPAVQRSGVLSHHSLVRGDHRPYYLDFDASILFADPAYAIEPASFCKLRLRDPRVVKQYSTNLHKLLAEHNVFERVDKLQEAVNNGSWTLECVIEYEAIDKVVTDLMLSAENALSRRISTKYQRSPQLKQAVQCLRYWQLRLRQVRNQPVALNQLAHFQENGAIDPDQLVLTSESEIKKAQHKAYQHLKEMQLRHLELRETYLEGLAEAIVLDGSPHFDSDSVVHIQKERREKQLKNLMSREKTRQMYRKIGRALNKSRGGGLCGIDVPDARAATETSGDPNDPKTWKGPWRSVTNPVEIAELVCKINSSQYHQAHHTPYGSGPIAERFGRRGDTPASVDLLRGTISPDFPPNIMAETLRVLRTLAVPAPQCQGNAVVSEEEFVSSYRVAQESTSSSPSGRHIGHYKAVVKDQLLIQLHSRMMSLPFQAGFAPQCWTKIVDIMLEKEENNPRCHRLRILALFEVI
jgi:hypothetical protein